MKNSSEPTILAEDVLAQFRVKPSQKKVTTTSASSQALPEPIPTPTPSVKKDEMKEKERTTPPTPPVPPTFNHGGGGGSGHGGGTSGFFNSLPGMFLGVLLLILLLIGVLLMGNYFSQLNRAGNGQADVADAAAQAVAAQGLRDRAKLEAEAANFLVEKAKAEAKARAIKEAPVAAPEEERVQVSTFSCSTAEMLHAGFAQAQTQVLKQGGTVIPSGCAIIAISGYVKNVEGYGFTLHVPEFPGDMKSTYKCGPRETQKDCIQFLNALKGDQRIGDKRVYAVVENNGKVIISQQ